MLQTIVLAFERVLHVGQRQHPLSTTVSLVVRLSSYDKNNLGTSVIWQPSLFLSADCIFLFLCVRACVRACVSERVSVRMGVGICVRVSYTDSVTNVSAKHVSCFIIGCQ